MYPNAQDAGDSIGSEPKQAHVTGPLEDLVNREIAPKDEISAVFHLIQRYLRRRCSAARSSRENFGPSMRVQ